MPCTSGFVDDVMFAHNNRPNRQRQYCVVTHHGQHRLDTERILKQTCRGSSRLGSKSATHGCVAERCNRQTACVSIGKRCYASEEVDRMPAEIYCPMPFESWEYSDCCSSDQGQPRCCQLQSTPLFYFLFTGVASSVVLREVSNHRHCFARMI